MNATDNCFKVPAANLTLLQERLAKLNKKAVKLCGEPITLTIIRDVEEPVVDAWGAATGRVNLFHVVSVAGPRPIINGWSLVAAMDLVRTEDGETMTMIRALPGCYWVPDTLRNNSTGTCEHCNISRNRKTVYCCRHSDGSYKIVGSSCLGDFLGHQTPEAVAASLTYMLEAFDICEDFESGGHEESRFSLGHYLGFVAAAVRAQGWLSRGAARQFDGTASATADIAAGVMVAVEKRQTDGIDPKFIPVAADWARAEAATDYMEVFLADHGEENDYLHNLLVLTKVGSVTMKTMGIAASLLVTAEREMGKEIERRKFENLARDSKHFGVAGEKVQVRVTVLATKEMEGDYGVTTMIRFATADRNVATWFASGSKSGDWEVGKEYEVVATVKKHDDYKGTKQTLLTRVKEFVAKAPKKKKAVDVNVVS